jgi:hypothetical protein
MSSKKSAKQSQVQMRQAAEHNTDTGQVRSLTEIEILEAISKGHSAMRALPHEQSAQAYALLRERMKLLAVAPKKPQEDLWILDSEPTFLQHA